MNADAKLKQTLSDQEYDILRNGGTEPAFSGQFVNHKQAGVYTCKACGAELFDSGTKFDSGTGWPSFTDPNNTENITLINDDSLGMQRTEVRCKQCDSHLGHVFTDGPGQSGQRYCINSGALGFCEVKKNQ